jgi:hypothetical protein
MACAYSSRPHPSKAGVKRKPQRGHLLYPTKIPASGKTSPRRASQFLLKSTLPYNGDAVEQILQGRICLGRAILISATFIEISRRSFLSSSPTPNTSLGPLPI